MYYYHGKKISELSRLSLRELKENIAINLEDYIERHKLFEDGAYSLMIPFKNGEAVRGKILIKDIHVDVEFDKDARIVKIKRRYS